MIILILNSLTLDVQTKHLNPIALNDVMINWQQNTIINIFYLQIKVLYYSKELLEFKFKY